LVSKRAMFITKYILLLHSCRCRHEQKKRVKHPEKNKKAG
jgi:hypothetical protein